MTGRKLMYTVEERRQRHLSKFRTTREREQAKKIVELEQKVENLEKILDHCEIGFEERCAIESEIKEKEHENE